MEEGRLPRVRRRRERLPRLLPEQRRPLARAGRTRQRRPLRAVIPASETAAASPSSRYASVWSTPSASGGDTVLA
ncbi:MAG TPA: hypothetical protein VFR81_29150 [Longimicrobium sp.]|nr:hypothetical protein [Longimicrobium sp.]